MYPIHDSSRRRRASVLGPCALAVVQTVGTFGAGMAQPGRRTPDLLAAMIAIAGPAALIAVRRFPHAVLAWVSILTTGYLLRGYPYGPVLLSMLIVVVISVVRGHRIAAWTATVAVVGSHLAARVLLAGHPWSWSVFAAVSAWVLLVLAAAELGRFRRVRVADLRRARAETRRLQENEERLRLAREIHDVVAHHMSLINVQASTALHLLGRRPENAEPALAAIKSASKEALVELRTLVDVLRDDAQPAPRAPTDRLASLPTLVERAGSAGLEVSLNVLGDRRALPTAVDHAAFRIVQEAITNVVRHADASHATITLDHGRNVLTVRVDDDGPGSGAILAGNGIRGMTERARSCGGTLVVERSASGGTRLTATLMIHDPLSRRRP